MKVYTNVLNYLLTQSMFKNLETKKSLLETRLINMEVMKWCLKKYQETQDDEYFNWAKTFGQWSKLYKQQLDELQ